MQQSALSHSQSSQFGQASGSFEGYFIFITKSYNIFQKSQQD